MQEKVYAVAATTILELLVIVFAIVRELVIVAIINQNKRDIISNNSDEKIDNNND